MATARAQHGGTVLCAIEVTPEEISAYGVFDVEPVPDGDNPDVLKVNGMVEKPKPGTAAYCNTLKSTTSKNACLKQVHAQATPKKAPTSATTKAKTKKLSAPADTAAQLNAPASAPAATSTPAQTPSQTVAVPPLPQKTI